MSIDITKLSALGLFAVLAACGEATDKPSPTPSNEITIEPTPELTEEIVVIDRLVPDMSTWTIPDGASLEKIEGDLDDTYRLAFTNGAALIGFDKDKPVRAGETITASFMAWSDVPETELRVRIVRFCSSSDVEQTASTRNLSETPTPIEISHTFERDHDCARLQFDTRQDEAEYYVSGVTVEKE